MPRLIDADGWWEITVRSFDGNTAKYYAKGSFQEVVQKAKEVSEHRILAHADGFMIEKVRLLFWGEKPNGIMLNEQEGL